jgi:DNA-binding transcriptional MocR family regulator
VNALRHDLGPFALVPEYLALHASPPALRLWCVLWIYTGNGTHDAWPSQSRLADDMGCSRRTVQRIVDELVTLGAMHIQTRSGTSSLYTLRWVTRSPGCVTRVASADTDVTPTYDTSVVRGTTPVTHKERQSEIDIGGSVTSDNAVHARAPGDAPLTREEIRQIRDRHAAIARLGIDL